LPSAERTAYPRFSPTVTASELKQSFTPTEGEREFAQGCTQTNQHAFCFLALLKCFQRLHYFPSMKEIPAIIVDHLRRFLQLRPEVPLAYENRRTLKRYEIPAFGTLNRVAQRVHSVVQRRLAQQAFNRLTTAQTQQLDRLLMGEFEQRQTEFNRLKKLPQRHYRSDLRDSTWKIYSTIWIG
jgi:hypothetical protein